MSNLPLSVIFHNYMNCTTSSKEVIDSIPLFSDSIGYARKSEHFTYVLFIDGSSALLYDAQPKLGIISMDEIMREEPLYLFIQFVKMFPQYQKETLDFVKGFLTDIREYNKGQENG